jgi:fatty-acyl-CoA synthase
MNEEALSWVCGAATPALLESTIGSALDAAAHRWPKSDALVSVTQGICWNYAELRDRSERFACGLLALGLAAGDRLAIWAPNCAEWVVVQFAAAKAGLILVNLNPSYRIAEVEYTLKKVGAKLLVTIDQLKTSNYIAIVEQMVPDIATRSDNDTAWLPALRHVVKVGGEQRPGWIEFDTIYDRCNTAALRDLAVAEANINCRDAVNIQFTSGTTGTPKGATLSHHNILNNGYFVGRAINLRHGDRLCIPVPLYHCFGMVMANLACITSGATMVFPSALFDAGAVLTSVEAQRCTVLYGVPTMFIAVLQHPDFASFDLSTLRTGIMAGSPCPVEIMRKVVGLMNMREITIAYGMTETSPVSFQSATTDPIERRVETVGRIQPHLESKIIGPDGAAQPVGVPGELCTRGYSVMLGYWDEPAATDAAIDAQGWMHSGDLAVIDNEGYCNIVGRIKDMVIRGGENIYPREIEEFLFRHPDVDEVSVVGVPDRRFGEELCAWIRRRPGSSLSAQELVAYCQGTIARYKIPRYFRFVDTFPLTVTGKVQKFAIRKAMINELGLTEDRTA